MKKVVVYPGRFQPMLAHHVEVYNQLQQQFPDAEVYIATSDKVDGDKSPFSFQEKQLIAQAQGIDPNKVLQVRVPYNADDYAQYFPADKTQLIFAVGEKDMQRFPFSNVDPETGLDMTVRGEPKPKYHQKINTYSTDPKPMNVRGYITLAPTVSTGDEIASASAFRDALKNAPDVESAKEVYTKQFGEYNEQVFNLIYNKIKGSQMNEDIRRMQKLAGLTEADMPDFGAGERPTNAKERDAYRKWKASQKAPAGPDGTSTAPPAGAGDGDYESPSPQARKDAAERPEKAQASDPANAIFTKIKPEDMMGPGGKPIPSKQRKRSIANRFPLDADINDPETKKAMFLRIAARSPYLLFSEINARLGNDDNSLAASDRLSDIVHQFEQGKSLMSISDEDKSFALKLMGNAIKNMELVRAGKDDTSLDAEEPDLDRELEDSVDLSDIRAEYGVDEDRVSPDNQNVDWNAGDQVQVYVGDNQQIWVEYGIAQDGSIVLGDIPDGYDYDNVYNEILDQVKDYHNEKNGVDEGAMSELDIDRQERDMGKFKVGGQVIYQGIPYILDAYEDGAWYGSDQDGNEMEIDIGNIDNYQPPHGDDEYDDDYETDLEVGHTLRSIQGESVDDEEMLSWDDDDWENEMYGRDGTERAEMQKRHKAALAKRKSQQTAENAFEAAMAQLKHLAGI